MDQPTDQKNIQNGRRTIESFREKAMVIHVNKVLGRKDTRVTDDLFSLGLDDEGIEKLISSLMEIGVNVKAENIRKYRTIKKIVREELKICYWENEYDPGKPVLVLVYGVCLVKTFVPLMKDLKRRFSVLAIEPVVEHWRYIFKDGSISHVLDLYEDLIRYNLPEGVRVHGFLGYSYGGDLSYRLACRWADKLGEHPYVYLIDTVLNIYDGSRFEEYKEEVLSRLTGKDRVAATVYWKTGYYCIDVPKKLGDGKDMPPYDGPVRLLSATIIKEEAFLASVLPVKAIMRENNPNVMIWKKLAPDIKIDYINADHMSIMSAPELHDAFFSFIDADLQAGQTSVQGS